MISTKLFKNMLKGVAVSALAVLMSSASYAQEVTLTLHHFLGPKSPSHKDFLAPWAKRIEDASEGRIKIEVFPSMSMGGKPGDLYGQARDGVADITWTLTGYTPGVFPRSEVFELPFVHQNSAAVTNQAIAEIFDEHLADDFTGIKPLLIHVHAGQAVHTVNRPIR
ncbi:MAG: C4-dicarboxylate ABC transporter substrate-binding protein, partial [Alphaproteobacteria bacterium]